MQALNAARKALRDAIVAHKDSQVAEDELAARGPEIAGTIMARLMVRSFSCTAVGFSE